MPQLEPTKPFLSAYAEEATALKRRSLLESAAVAHELGNLIQIASSAVNIIARSSRFDSFAGRDHDRAELDSLLSSWLAERDGYDVMGQLQSAGVAAGVCQTAEDRCERDPQLAHLGWLTEVTGTKIGRWPVAEVPFRLSESFWGVGALFFGLWLIPMGWVAATSTRFPQALGWILIVGGGCYIPARWSNTPSMRRRGSRTRSVSRRPSASSG